MKQDYYIMINALQQVSIEEGIMVNTTLPLVNEKVSSDTNSDALLKILGKRKNHLKEEKELSIILQKTE